MSSDFESARNRSHGELDRPSFVAALKASGALQFGTFTLASGKTSSYYVDIKKAITRPDLLRRIAKAMAPYARGASRIAGVELDARDPARSPGIRSHRLRDPAQEIRSGDGLLDIHVVRGRLAGREGEGPELEGPGGLQRGDEARPVELTMAPVSGRFEIR